jgi:hypothetical protein
MAQTLDSRGRGSTGLRLALALLIAAAAIVAGGCGVFGGDDEGEDTTTAAETTEGETTSEGETTADGEAAQAEESAAETEASAGDTEAGELAAENEEATAEETAAAEEEETPGVTTTVDPVTGETITSTTATTATTATTGTTGTATGTTTIAGETGTITIGPDGEVVIPPATDTATSLPPVRDGETTNTQAGLSMIPGLGSRATFPRFFSPGSPWNTDVSEEPVDQRSERMIERARIRVAVREENGQLIRVRRPLEEEGVTINTTRWTVPLFSEQGGVDTVAVCRQVDCGPDAVESIRLPPSARPDPRFDGWMTVINSQTREAHDFWRARREQDGSISYHFVKKWDLNGPGFQEPGGVSARGSGLPLFAGLIRPEEIDRGRIDHALAIAVPGAAKERFVQPASRTDGVGFRDSIPEGARLRLRFRNSEDYINRACPADERARYLREEQREARARNRQLARDQNREFNPKGEEARKLARIRARILRQDLARAERRPCGLARSPEAQLTKTFVRNDVHRRTAQVIIEALKHYGAIVVERAASPTLYAQRNARWKKIMPPNLLQDIVLRNFEVLEMPRTLNDPGSFTEVDPFTGLPTAAPASLPGTATGTGTGTTTTGTTGTTTGTTTGAGTTGTTTTGTTTPTTGTSTTTTTP